MPSEGAHADGSTEIDGLRDGLANVYDGRRHAVPPRNDGAVACPLARRRGAQPALRAVTFMDTHAVTAVVHCANRLFAEGGRLVVYRPPASLRRIFELMWGGDSGARLFISGERGEL